MPKSSINYGIQADAVKGNAIAVGPGARAESVRSNDARAIEVQEAIARFFAASAPIDIPLSARAELSRRLDLVGKEITNESPQPNSISEHLKEASTIVDSVAKIVEGGAKLVAPFQVVVTSVSAALSLLGLR